MAPENFVQSLVEWQSIHIQTQLAKYFPLSILSGVDSTLRFSGAPTRGSINLNNKTSLYSQQKLQQGCT